MIENIDSFIAACEENMIDSDIVSDDIDTEDIGLDAACEGINIDTAKMIHDKDVKEARLLLKESKKLMRKHTFESLDLATSKLAKSKTLIEGMKRKIDDMPESFTFWGKIKSAFTPIFTMLPSKELESVSPGMYSGFDGSMGLTFTAHYKTYTDKMSETTNSEVKRVLQEILNLFLHDLGKIINICEREKQRLSKKSIIRESSLVSILGLSPSDSALESTQDQKLPELDEAFSDDPIAVKVAYMIANSHEYKGNPNIDAAIIFTKNYKWKEKTMKLDKMEGINKPIIKEKVFEIAKDINPEEGMKFPLVVVDKIHGIYPQSHNKGILFDGHHRKEAMVFRDIKETPVYYGTYTGDAEKDVKELTGGNESDMKTAEFYKLLKERLAENDEVTDKIDDLTLESVLIRALESKITTEERKALPDSAFALPSKRKFPLYLSTKENTINHIKQAIKFFIYCPGEDRKEMAQNIKKAADKYKVEIADTSIIRKYL